MHLNAALRHAQENYPSFLASLANELSSAAKPADARRLAGIVLKNALDAKDEVRKADLQARWSAVDPALRANIREALLATLRVDIQDVRHTAALAIAKVRPAGGYGGGGGGAGRPVETGMAVA